MMAPKPEARLRRIALALITLALGVTAVSACEDSTDSGATISPETFVEVMVQLRTSPLVDDAGQVPQTEAQRILDQHQLTADHLTGFVEVHALNVPFMANLWYQIERRVSEIQQATGL